MVRIDQIAIGIVWGFVVWPEVRQSLMDNLFCNPAFQNDFSESLVFGLGFCNYTVLLFYIILPIVSFFSYLPYIMKFVSWIQDMRN